MNFTNAVLDLLFPAFCINCKKEGHYICNDCDLFLSEAALICPLCQESSFTGERHPSCRSRYGLDGLVALWDYDGPVKELIAKIKYNFVTHAAKEIIGKAFAVIVGDPGRFGSFLAFLQNRPDLTFTPMFLRKERKRGFNQAGLLAKEISVIFGNQVIQLLQKTKNTKSQTELSQKERLQNVREVFQLNNQYASSNSEKIPNFLIPKNIVLADDVWTTGATMKECCKVLKKAGAEKVWGFTLAKTL